MNIDIEKIDIDKLREELIDYFTAAMYMISPVALVDLSEVENATNEELIKIALENKFDLKKYLK